MENLDGLTQEERFEKVQDFKRNLSARLEEHIQRKQEQLDKYKCEQQQKEREERIRKGIIIEDDLNYIDYE